MVIFVSDLFVEDYVGGAELTFEALINNSLLPIAKAHSSKITADLMKQHHDKYWIFGNFSNVSESALLYAAKNLNYSIVECDYKFCKFRSIEKHQAAEGSCNCNESRQGKIISILYSNAKSVWFMSARQKEIYLENFPFLAKGDLNVLSSIFSKDTIERLGKLREQKKNNKWIISSSQSWIKGTEDAIEHAKQNNLEYEALFGVDYHTFLNKLASSKGLIFLPRGGDTCPRLVIEAKLLGCELALNENVQHKDEEWFNKDIKEIEDYLLSRPHVFWKSLDEVIVGTPSSSGKKEDNHFTIVVPSYNNEDWVEKNIDSIASQNYKNYDVLYMNDASTDNTGKELKKILEQLDKDVADKFTIVNNEENKRALHNIYRAVGLAKKGSIIILLDGDDWFSSYNVLSKLNDVYDKDVWITAGSFMDNAQGMIKTPKIDPKLWEGNIRKFNNQPGHDFSHLRTFRKELFDKIEKEDLLDKDGGFYKYTFDQALMFPMIEMSGPEHFLEVSEVLLTYNRMNPISVDKVHRTDQLRIERDVKNKKPYERIQKI